MLLKHFPSQYNGANYKGHVVYNMDGGGDSPPPQPTATSQVTIPEYAQPYMESLLGKAEALTSSPYQTYGGQRMATSTPEQQAARESVAGMSGPGQYDVATGLAGAAGLSALGAGNYVPGQFDPSQVQASGLQQYQMAQPDAFGTAQAQQYMSPFMQNVLDVQKAAAIRDAQKAQLAQNLGAARTGSYGGARQLLATTERERALGGQLADIQAKGLQSAFENAQAQFERDRAARMMAGRENLAAQLGVQKLGAEQSLEAQRLNQALDFEAQRLGEQSRQFGAGLGMQGAQTAIQSAQTLGGLGTAQQQSALELARAQETFGGLNQAEQQRALDLGYQDFLAQQQYPYKQLGFMSDLLRGSSNLAGTGGKTVYEAPPSQLSQIVGPGLLGLGIYREFGRQS